MPAFFSFMRVSLPPWAHRAAFRRIADDGSGDHRRSLAVRILAPAGLFFSIRARIFRRLHPLADLLLFPQSGAAAVENEICSRTLFKRSAFRCVLFAAFLFFPGKHLGCRGNPRPSTPRPWRAARHHPWRSSRCLCSFFSRVFSAAGKHRRKFVVEIPPGKCYNENNSKSNLKIGGDESVRTQKEKTNTRSVWQPH